MTRGNETVRLLEADPELGALLTGNRRAEAERELVVRTHRLSVGPWDVSRLADASGDHVGLLVLDGVLSRELVVADHVSAELLGPGDLGRPLPGDHRVALRPPRRALPAPGHDAGDLAAHARRPPPEGAVLAPGGALG